MVQVENLKHISPSSLNAFLNHYDQWYSRYILGEKIPNNIYMCAGTAVHNFLEDFFEVGPKPGETISSFATRRFSECYAKNLTENKELLQFLSADDSPYALTDLLSWVEAKIRTWVDETSRIEKKYGAARAFEFNSPCKIEEEIKDFIGEVPIKGYIDAVYQKSKWSRENGLEFQIADYKTSSKQMETIHADYFVQLLMYAYVYKRRGKRVKWVIVDYVKYNQKYFFRVNDALIEALERLVADVWVQMNERVRLHNEGVDVSKMRTDIKLEDYL